VYQPVTVTILGWELGAEPDAGSASAARAAEGAATSRLSSTAAVP
jgi:hypothetical protein